MLGRSRSGPRGIVGKSPAVRRPCRPIAELRCRYLDQDLPMRGISQAMTLRWRSPLPRKSCFSIAFRANAAACSSLCRFSRGSNIHSRMIARRAAFSGLMIGSFSWFLSLKKHARLTSGSRSPRWTVERVCRFGPSRVCSTPRPIPLA